jgi:hypothetical protein
MARPLEEWVFDALTTDREFLGFDLVVSSPSPPDSHDLQVVGGYDDRLIT